MTEYRPPASAKLPLESLSPFSRRKERAFAAISFSLTLILCLLVAEIGLRILKRDVAFQPDQDLIRSLLPRKDQVVPTYETEENLNGSSQEIPRTPACVIAHTNNLGFRMIEDVMPKETNEKRILLLGDSYAEALDAEGSRFTDIVDLRLRSLSPPGVRWRLINGGIQNGCPSQYVLQLRRFLPEIKPDIVLVALAPNDLNDDMVFERDYGFDFDEAGIPIRPRCRFRLWLLKKSYLLRYIEMALQRAAPRIHQIAFPPASPGTQVVDWKALLCTDDEAARQLFLRKTGRYLERLREMTEAHHARFGVFLIHYLNTFDDEPYYTPRFPTLEKELERYRCHENRGRPYNEFMEAFLRGNRFLYWNPYEALMRAKQKNPKRKLWNFYDYHFSRYGHQVVAEDLLAFLKPML